MPPIRQQKKHKKWLNLYRQYYGIHKPYAVLLEPIFLKEARRRKLAIRDHLQRVFLQTSFPLLTRCTVTYVRDKAQTDQSWDDAKEAVRRIQIVECAHKKGEEKDPIECIKSVVESPPTHGHTASKFVVASEDSGLRAWCRQREGQPLLYIETSRFALDKPSKKTKAKAKELDHLKMGAAPAAAAPAAASAKPAAASTVSESLGAPASPPLPAPFVKMHRKARRGPNPLSVLKRKRPTDDDDSSASEAPAQKPRTSTRRGSRAGKQVKAKRAALAAAAANVVPSVATVEVTETVME